MKNLQLGISAIVVIIAGLVYGFNPDAVLAALIGIDLRDLELKHIFKGIMGLYLAFGIFWIYGIFRPPLWKAATLSNVFFMGGIAFGRGVSLLLDGFSIHFAIAMILELFMMFWGLHNLTTKNVRIN